MQKAYPPSVASSGDFISCTVEGFDLNSITCGHLPSATGRRSLCEHYTHWFALIDRLTKQRQMVVVFAFVFSLSDISVISHWQSVYLGYLQIDFLSIVHKWMCPLCVCLPWCWLRFNWQVERHPKLWCPTLAKSPFIKVKGHGNTVCIAWLYNGRSIG